MGCCLTSCSSNYHFMCARQRNCVFLEDKKVYCQRHRDLIKGEVGTHTHFLKAFFCPASDEINNINNTGIAVQVVSDAGFEVTRRVLVDFEGIRLRRKFLNGLEPENVHMMIGEYITIFWSEYRSFLTFIQTHNVLKPCLFILNAGSMTIDCLGMLTELSDCERKLFPVGYQ